MDTSNSYGPILIMVRVLRTAREFIYDNMIVDLLTSLELQNIKNIRNFLFNFLLQFDDKGDVSVLIY